jgi:hypothetical protein
MIGSIGNTTARVYNYGQSQHRSGCSCPGCSRLVYNFTQPAIPQANQTQPNTQTYALPTAAEVQRTVNSNSQLKAVADEAVPFLDGPLPDCISQNYAEVPLDDPKLRQFVPSVDQDVKNGENVKAILDLNTGSYIVFVNRTTNQEMSVKEQRDLVVKHQYERTQGHTPPIEGVGVEAHERLHVAFMKMNPDIDANYSNQGVKYIINGSEEKPVIRIETFGQSVFYNNRLIDRINNSIETFQQAKDAFIESQKQNFANWTEQTYQQLKQTLVNAVNNLQFAVREVANTALAAEIPLYLKGRPNLDKHSTPSPEDNQRYQESRQLEDQVKSIIAEIQSFMKYAEQSWQEISKRGFT